MDIINVIKVLAIILAFCSLVLFFIYRKEEDLTRLKFLKTALIGFISNYLDTCGIGSFALIVFFRRLFNVLNNNVDLIGTMNIQAVLPTLLQSLIFLHFIHVDLVTLLVACTMISLGGFLSGYLTITISEKLVKNIMVIAFSFTAVLLFLSQLNIVNIYGSSIGVYGNFKLAVFALLMLFAGSLPAFGVGYYALVQNVVFLFGVNPLIAFPIMTTASAFQMPITSIPFITHKKFYFKSAIVLALTGCVGVMLAAPFISNINSYQIKWLLFVITLNNIYILLRK